GNGRFVGTVLFDPSSGPPFAVGNAAVIVKLNADQLDGLDAEDFSLANHNHDTNYWKLTGNAGANSTNGAFLGTTDNQPLDIRVNNQRVLRIEPGTANISPNLIGGFRGNIASNAFFQSSARGAVIVGGGQSTGPNVVEDDFGVIVGGSGNTNNGNSSFIGGGIRNYVEDRNNVLVGGLRNSVDGRQCFLGGGETNVIRSISIDSVITGGSNNLVRADFAAIGGGANNIVDASSDFGTVSGGANNEIDSFILYGTIPGGFSNFVDGDYAFAAGRRARAVHDGAFVWADSQDTNFASTANNQVSFRCLGGVRFASGSGAVNRTVSWTPGSASWSFSSDRNLKEDIRPVDGAAVLEKLARVPISEWNYKGYAQRHIGPMAQDFHGAFPLNESTTTLNDADLHGVALAAIQGLNEKLNATVKEKESRIAALEKTVAELKDSVAKMATKR
ncbi:MAG TPA: tail fiber domain-containing protein, partial [Methylomirabilota bacterium]|nr:tail fiber domain-containing protein [Methylomirabilota bacterium]